MYSLSKQAVTDFKAIYARGGELFGVAQADKYAAGLEKTFRFLADHPRAARERTETNLAVRVFAYKAHLIVYLVEGGDILILRIRHVHEDWLTNPF